MADQRKLIGAKPVIGIRPAIDEDRFPEYKKEFYARYGME